MKPATSGVRNVNGRNAYKSTVIPNIKSNDPKKKNIIITINIYIYIYKAKNIPNLIPLSLCRSHLRHNDELPNSDNFRHRLPSKYSNHI